MAKARNKVIAGDYNNTFIRSDRNGVHCGLQEINKETITDYELVTAEKIKSGSSAIIRGAIGGVALGPIGLLAAVTAKNNGINTVAIAWKNGKKSLVEIDDKLYKSLVAAMF